MTYTNREAWALAASVALGLMLNVMFLYGAAQQNLLRAALANPIAVALMVEALVLLALVAYVTTRWHVTTLGWKTLVVLALLGGLAFAMAAILLWDARLDPTHGVSKGLEEFGRELG